MADEGAKAWLRIARSLAADLPGTWRVAGTGIRAVVAREPIDWLVVWFGASRVRRDDDPCLIGGEASLVGPPFNLAIGHGLRSDTRRDGPKRIQLSEPNAVELTRDFVLNDVLPRVERWSPEQLAQEAEDQLARPAAERGRPSRFPDAAGWRVVLDQGSPEQPVAEYKAWEGAEAASVRWYDELLEAWRSGGRERALQYLVGQRDQALADLKLG